MELQNALSQLTKTQEIVSLLQKYTSDNDLSITLDLVGSWLWVYGNDTKAHKDFIKSLGFKWSSKKMKWYYHEKPFFKTSKRDFTYEEIQSFNKSQKLI